MPFDKFLAQRKRGFGQRGRGTTHAQRRPGAGCLRTTAPVSAPAALAPAGRAGHNRRRLARALTRQQAAERMHQRTNFSGRGTRRWADCPLGQRVGLLIRISLDGQGLEMARELRARWPRSRHRLRSKTAARERLSTARAAAPMPIRRSRRTRANCIRPRAPRRAARRLPPANAARLGTELAHADADRAQWRAYRADSTTKPAR